jgi:fructokinase
MTAKPSRPAIFGEVLYDRFPGQSVLGGAPFNVAWHLQAFGQNPLLISRVGEDELGSRIVHAMHDWGMDTSALQLDPEHPTGTVEVDIVDSEPHYDILDQTAYDFIDSSSLPSLAPGTLLYHGSLALRHSVSRQALATLKSRYETSLFIDVNLRPPWWQIDTLGPLLEDARCLKLNEAELLALGGRSGPLPDQARAMRRQLALELLIVTCGSRGAIAVSSDDSVARIAPEKSAKVVDSVGAGDAFTSVMILGLQRQWPLAEALFRAQQFASAIVEVRGATVRQREFYQTWINNWNLER